mmetsp:Transcript_7387/g.20872  ORF Transcript_7387/g.20872 Transcript_7387/m.20872 type:complete len:129 (+) Transcript_7387:593-979(+)
MPICCNSVLRTQPHQTSKAVHPRVSARAAHVVAMAATKPNITVNCNPSKAFLEAEGVTSWGTWGCEASKFPWTYSENEKAYILEGEVVVTPTGGDPVTIKAGDFVTFPKGMSCTWDVKKAINKYFCFY